MDQLIALLQENNQLLRALLAKTSAAQDDDPIFEPREAAEYLHISYDTLLSWRKQGIITGSKPGGHKLLFRKSECDECLRRLEAETESASTEKRNPVLRAINCG